MPRLNLNKELAYLYHDKFDYEEEYNQYFNWCTDSECPCGKDWNGDTNSLNVNTIPLSGDSYPFRESFRTKEQRIQGWDFIEDRYPRVQGKIIWTFLTRFLDGSLGKKFDEVYSKYCKIASKLSDKHYYFMRQFEGRRPYYCIDSEGLIQENNWWKRPKKKKDPYLFESADFRYAGFHKRTGLPMEIYTNNHQWLRHRTSEGNFENRIISGYQVENVIPKSKLERRLIWEKIQKQRQLNKYWRNQDKLKQYSFLTDKEKEDKKVRRSQISAKFIISKLKKSNIL